MGGAALVESSVRTPRRNAMMPGHHVTRRRYITGGAALIDTQGFRFAQSAPCERRVVTRCRATTSRAAEKTTAARCQAGCGCKLSEVKGGGSCVFHKGKGRQLTPAIPPGNARAAVRGRVGQESHRRNRTSEARLTREARARITSQPSNLKPDPSTHRKHAATATSAARRAIQAPLRGRTAPQTAG